MPGDPNAFAVGEVEDKHRREAITRERLGKVRPPLHGTLEPPCAQEVGHDEFALREADAESHGTSDSHSGKHPQHNGLPQMPARGRYEGHGYEGQRNDEPSPKARSPRANTL